MASRGLFQSELFYDSTYLLFFPSLQWLSAFLTSHTVVIKTGIFKDGLLNAQEGTIIRT